MPVGFGRVPGFEVMDSLLPIFVVVIFVIVIADFAVIITKGLGQWNGNNNAPQPALRLNGLRIRSAEVLYGQDPEQLKWWNWKDEGET